MLEFTKREYENEYSVWCTEEYDFVGNHINDLQDVINKVNELNNLVKDSEYFKHQKELLDGNN